MAKMIAALFITLSLPGSAWAQMMVIPAPCIHAELKAVSQNLFDKYGEKQTRQAISAKGMVFMLFENADTGTYTIQLVSPDGSICQLDSGTAMEHLIGGPEF